VSIVSDEDAARILARMSVTSRVDFGKRHRHTDKRAALHRSRPPADQSGQRVASWTGKSPDTPDTHDLLRGLVADILARMSRGCYDENGPVEVKLYGEKKPNLTQRGNCDSCTPRPRSATSHQAAARPARLVIPCVLRYPPAAQQRVIHKTGNT